MAFLRKMEEMFSQGKYSELLRFCREQMEVYPDDVDVRFHHACALEALGRHTEAKNAFSRLFRDTSERIFLVCGALPDFSEGRREEAVGALEKEIEEDANAENLFFAFEVAVKNGESATAKRALMKAFQAEPKKTIELIQGMFEKSKGASMQKRLLFATLIGLLKSLERK